MFSDTIGKAATHSQTQKPPVSGSLIAKKIWLPKLLYNSLPWFYLVSGILALLASLYIGEWFWVLPHYALFSIACLHLGLLVLLRRRRSSIDAENDSPLDPRVDPTIN